MLKHFVIFLALVICLFSTSTAKVYDIAGIIGTNQVLEIDSEISSYESKTGIKITVITIGAGDERLTINGASENEMILTVIPHKKLYSVEVGRGLQRWITNNYASLILKRNISEVIEMSDYATGIGVSVTDIINKLGGKSISERIEQITIAEKRSDKIVTSVVSVFLWIIIFFSFCLTGFFVLSRYKLLNKEKINHTEKSTNKNKSSELDKDDKVVVTETCENVEEELAS
jgi:uncharacterized membrane protein YgcG